MNLNSKNQKQNKSKLFKNSILEELKLIKSTQK